MSSEPRSETPTIQPTRTREQALLRIRSFLQPPYQPGKFGCLLASADCPVCGELNKLKLATQSGWVMFACLNGCEGSDIRTRLQIKLEDQRYKPDDPTIVVAASPDFDGLSEAWPEPIPLDYADELPPFPMEVLPVVMRMFVQTVSIGTQTPPDITAMLCLSAIAACIQRKVIVSSKPGHYEPTSAMIIVPLESGNRKSAVFETVTAPIQAWEAQEDERTKVSRMKAEMDISIATKELEYLKNQIAKSQDAFERSILESRAADLARKMAMSKNPMAPEIIADDITSEALVTMLVEQGGRAAVMSAEGDIFGIIAGERYASGMGSLPYKKGHAGDLLKVRRKTRHERVIRPAVTLGISPQPVVMRGVGKNEKMHGEGVFARFWYSLPKDKVGRRDTHAPPPDQQLINDWSQLIQNLLNEKWEQETVLESGTLSGQPRLWEFNDVAAELMAECFDAIEPRLGPDGDLHTMKAWGSKLYGAITRLAALLHAARWAEYAEYPPVIAQDTASWAIKLGLEYLVPHAKEAFNLMGTDEAMEDAKYVLRRMVSSGQPALSEQEVWQRVKRHVRFGKSQNLKAALAILCDRQYLRAALPPWRGVGRKPAPVYYLHPDIIEGTVPIERSEVERGMVPPPSE